MKLEITNAHIVDPANGINKVTCLFIHEQKIVAVEHAPDGWNADNTINAKGHYLFPGFVDIATRLREPGQEYKATIASETFAAVSGGITSLACLPDTDPPINSPAEVELIQHRANLAGNCHVYTIGALTNKLHGSMLSEMSALKKAGCVGVSNVLNPFANDSVLRRAMEYASSQNLTVFLHPLNHELAADGSVHEGIAATRMGLAGIPSAAETASIGACLALIEQTNIRVHFCRLSTARSLQMLARAKYEGAPVSADICAHQLFLCDQDIHDFDSNFHVIPPLRSKEDLQGLRARLDEEVIMALCSDHQPHERDAKLAPFAETEAGISSLETLLPLTLKLVSEKVITLNKAIALLTEKPAKLLGIEAGTLSPEAPADFCIVDPELTWQLNESSMLSQGKNTPFLNQTFQGKVTATFVNGKQVYQLND